MISKSLRNIYPFRNNASFYCEELLASRPTPKPENHPLSAVRDSSFNIFAATLHPQPEDAPCRGDRDPLTMATRQLCHH